MTRIRKGVFRSVLLLAIVSNWGMALAEPEEEVALVRVQPPGVAGPVVPLADIHSGAVELGIKANRKMTRAWQRENIRHLWAQLKPGARPLSEVDLNHLMQLDFPAVRIFPREFQPLVVALMRGVPTLGLTSVGMLLKGTSEENFKPWCTITLTRPDTILTALHCVTGRQSDERFKVYFPYEGLRDVVISTEYISLFCVNGAPPECSEFHDDLATIRLPLPYVILPPEARVEAATLTAGAQGRAVGFGLTDSDLSDEGIRRDGNVTPAICSACTPQPDPTIAGREICFKTNLTDLSAVRMAGYDSGGPLFYDDVGEERIKGIARGESDCSAESQIIEAKYVDVTNMLYDVWLSEKAFNNQAPPVSSTDRVNILWEIAVAELETGDQHEFDIAIEPWAKELIVTMNHEVGPKDSPVNLDLDLPGELNAQCKRHKGVEVCIAEQPAAGPYTFTLTRNDVGCAAGIPGCSNPDKRSYQLTALTVNCPDLECWEDWD